MDNELSGLYSKFIDDFLKKNDNPLCKGCIVKDSIPIVHFGNLENYQKSKRRILTIGLNPSNNEFTKERFEIIDFKKGNERDNIERLHSTLNKYFEFNPYKNWFDNYEKVLKVIGASYYENPVHDTGFENYDKAIHIDIYSSIATDPTWGKLDDSVKSEMQNTDLFMELLQYLDPNIILVSCNKVIFQECFSEDEYVCVEERFQNKDSTTRSYLRKYVHSSGTQLLWGFNNRGTPFGLSKNFIKDNVPEMIS